jgi:hypothetical protein
MKKVNLYFKNCVGQMKGDELCYTYLYLQFEGRGEGEFVGLNYQGKDIHCV